MTQAIERVPLIPRREASICLEVGHLEDRIVRLLSQSSAMRQKIIEEVMALAHEGHTPPSLFKLKKKLVLLSSHDPKKAFSILQKCVQERAVISKKVLGEERTRVDSFFYTLEKYQNRISVLEQQKKVVEAIEGLFLKRVGSRTNEVQQFLQKKLLDEESQQGFLLYAESLPFIQEIFDSKDKVEASVVRERMQLEHPGLLEKVICFAFQNRDLNSFLHEKKFRTRAEDFFYTLSFLPFSPSAQEVTQFETRMKESGLQETVDLSHSIEMLEKRIASYAKRSKSVPLASLKEYLPLGYQRLSMMRMEEIDQAIVSVQSSIDRMDTKDKKKSQRELDQKLLLLDLQELKQKTNELRAKVDHIESSSRRFGFLHKIGFEFRKLHVGQRSKENELYGRIEALHLEKPFVAPSLQAVKDVIEWALHLSESSYTKKVIGLLKNVQTILEEAPPLEGLGGTPLSAPALLSSLDKYSEFISKELVSVVGHRHPLLLSERSKKRVSSTDLSLLSPSDQTKFETLRSAIGSSQKLWNVTTALSSIVSTTLPGDIVFTHESYRDIAHRKEEKSLRFVRKQIYGLVFHVDLIVAQKGKVRFCGLFGRGIGAVSKPVTSLFSFQGKGYRPDVFSLLSEKAKKILMDKWAPMKSKEDQERIVRERLVDRYAEILQTITSGEKIPGREKEQMSAYTYIKNTQANIAKRYLGYISYFFTMGWLVKAICWITHKRFGYKVSEFNDPIPAPTSTAGMRAKYMFCSEFVASLVVKAQHSLEEYVRKETGLTDTKETVMTPSISKDRPLFWWFPKQLRMLMKRAKVLSLQDAPVNYFIFGPRKLFRRQVS